MKASLIAFAAAASISQVALVILKLLNVIQWAWVAVFIPAIASASLLLSFIVVAVICAIVLAARLEEELRQ